MKIAILIRVSMSIGLSGFELLNFGGQHVPEYPIPDTGSDRSADSVRSEHPTGLLKTNNLTESRGPVRVDSTLLLLKTSGLEMG